MQEKEERNLLSFLMLFLTFINFAGVLPSLGSRFKAIFYLFGTLYIFLFMVKVPGKKLHFITWIGLFPMLLYAAINFRLGSESISAFLLAPGLGLPLFVPGLPISDFLFN